MAKYIITPLEHLLSLDKPSLHMFPGAADWPSKNLTIDQKRLKKRPGYSEDRDIGSKVQSVWLYQENDGTRNTMYLTDADLMLRTTGASETWAYKTETLTYTAKIVSISGTTVTLKTGETPNTDGVAALDYFILHDDYTANQQPSGGDTDWTLIASSADGPPPTITLSVTYPGTTGSWSGSEKTGYVRRVYTTPSNERWQAAVVNNKFCFVNGAVNGQYWGGSNYAADLNTTYATRAKYCIEYGNRLCLANIYDSGTAAPWTLRSSKNGDPTDYTDSTSQDYVFQDTEETLSGMGKVGANLMVYKTNSFYIGYKTGEPDDPFVFPSHKKGKGLYAPYSLVHAMGTNLFLGHDDFYIIEGDEAQPIGERIRHQFFDIVGETEAQNTWGFYNSNENEVIWFANSSEGLWAFVFDIKDREWGAYWFGDQMTGAGKGGV